MVSPTSEASRGAQLFVAVGPHKCPGSTKRDRAHTAATGRNPAEMRGGRGKRAAAGIGCRPNGLEVNPRGQGPRGYGSAARRMPAFEARDAGGVTPFKIPLNGLSGAHGIRSCPLM